MEFFRTIFDFISELHPGWYFLLVFLAYFAENLFPPLPGDTMLVLTAYIFGLHHERLMFLWLYLSSIAGAIAGFMLMFGLGRYYGRKFFIERNYKYASRKFFLRVEAAFNRHGWGVLLWNRIFFGLRPVIGLFSGMSKMRADATLALLLVSAVVFNALFILLGFLLGKNWPLIESILQKYTLLTLLAALLLVALFLFRLIKHRKE
ncbi:MAG: VTT domain-containing protein [Candidatus Neomarinimicrobiota bacterium]|jgi:membrane protein DedA with SNARE-associated domain|nr:VTT domain-containing protein [Candidatus Neomarinimicrobiota bacterium]MDX9780111.1 VTT domain-containing protein [bacterium]